MGGKAGGLGSKVGNISGFSKIIWVKDDARSSSSLENKQTCFMFVHFSYFSFEP